ncbi:MAG: hypothetical protein WCI73_11750, partial [Phycisphaerae bacterium]
MRLRMGGLTAALVVLAAAVPVQAAISFTTQSGALNPAGQGVAARLDVTIAKDRLVVRLSNMTQDLAAFEQTLDRLSFSIAKKEAHGSLGVTNAQTAHFAEGGVQIASQMTETNWTLSTAGNRFTLRAPGQQRTILPDLHGGGLDKANASITAPGVHEFLTGPVYFEILVPGLTLTDEITGVSFGWAGAEEGDPKISSDTTNNMDSPGLGFSLPGDLLLGPGQQATEQELISDPVRAYADSVSSGGGPGSNHDGGSGGPVSGWPSTASRSSPT